MKDLSFSKIIKNELCDNVYTDSELKALIAGFTRINAEIIIRDHVVIIDYHTELSKVAKLLFEAFKHLYGIKGQFSYFQKMHFEKTVVYHFSVSEKAEKILDDLEIYRDYEKIKPSKTIQKDNFRFYLAGLFMATGVISHPKSSHYYLEISFDDEADATFFNDKLNKLKYDRTLDFHQTTRRNKEVIYLKKSDQIAVFLAMIGASEAMMDFEGTRINRDYINSENRLQICVNANYQRSLKKGRVDIEAINVLINNGQLPNLDDKLQALVKIRLENEDASLNSLADLLEDYGFVVSKSGVNHLLIKIRKLAEEYK